MEQEDISPFFYRCHLKASRKESGNKSGRNRPVLASELSYSDEREERGGSRNDASDYSERGAVFGGAKSD
jgi:hypothetical protein